MKRIVVCFDGTWNTPDDNEQDHDELEAGEETNVVKLYRSILGRDLTGIPRGASGHSPRIATVKWYDQGVGARWYEHVRGGTFGFGLSRNIREGYKCIIDHYTPGDEIYIFGFSRGAYTARSLVGLIRNSGVLKPEHAREPDPDDNPILLDAYQLYRARDGSADTPFAQYFRAKYAHDRVNIKVLGVWDTVGALGIPLKVVQHFSAEHYKFHDVELSGIVQHAYHALAIDEHREDFQPTLWAPRSKPQQTLEQVWFVGAHADVGGGYANQPLSDVTLHWMQEKAKLNGEGLEIDPTQEPVIHPEHYLSAKVTDSFGRFAFGLYKLFHQRYVRPVLQTTFGNESLHPTYLDRRQRDPDYKPKNSGL